MIKDKEKKRLIDEFLRDLDFIDIVTIESHVFERIRVIINKWKEK